MTNFRASDRDVDRVIRSWLHEDRHEDASRLAGAVLDRVDTIPQRRATWWPAWRTPFMNKIIATSLGAAAVVLALFVGAQLFGAPGTGVGGPGTEPSATPQPTATPEPSPTPSPVAAPPLTGSLTSDQHGIALSYPEGWTVDAATDSWTGSEFALAFGGAHADWVSDPILESSLFLAVASQPTGGVTSEEWMAEVLANYEDGCAATEPIDIDGAEGLIGTGDCMVAVVTTQDRGYWIQLYTSSDDPAAVAPYDRAWFEELLATVELRPEDAAD